MDSSENTIYYQLFLTTCDVHGKLDIYLKHVEKYYHQIQWAQDNFKLEVSDEPYVLRGQTKFDDSVQDEWLVIHILYNLSNLDPELVIRIYDSDGNILLIEAAEHLPPWLNSKHSDYRVFVYRNRLHIIPIDISFGAESLSTPIKKLKAAASYLRNQSEKDRRSKLPSKTLADKKIQSTICAKLRGLPDRKTWLDRRVRFFDKVIFDSDFNTRESDSDSDSEEECTNTNLNSHFKESLTLEKIAAMSEEFLEVGSESSSDSTKSQQDN